MNKKILIGSIITFALLLLMPSIPAIQHKSIDYQTSVNHIQKLNDVSIKDLREDIKNNYWKHPIINLLSLITATRAFRGFFLVLLSISNPFNPDEYPEVDNYLYFIRGIWLLATGSVLNSILYLIAKNMGWEFYSYLHDFLNN